MVETEIKTEYIDAGQDQGPESLSEVGKSGQGQGQGQESLSEAGESNQGRDHVVAIGGLEGVDTPIKGGGETATEAAHLTDAQEMTASDEMMTTDEVESATNLHA